MASKLEQSLYCQFQSRVYLDSGKYIKQIHFDASRLIFDRINCFSILNDIPHSMLNINNTQQGQLYTQAGAAGILVSNHGACQLDYVPQLLLIQGGPEYEARTVVDCFSDYG